MVIKGSTRISKNKTKNRTLTIVTCISTFTLNHVKVVLLIAVKITIEAKNVPKLEKPLFYEYSKGDKPCKLEVDPINHN